MAGAAPKSERDRLLARIHMAQKALCLKREDYKAILMELTGLDSAGDMNRGQLVLATNHLEALAFGEKRRWKKGYPGRPKNMDRGDSRSRQMKKIEAYLAEAGRDWPYAEKLAKRICKVERLAWVPADQLYKIITALKKDAERHDREPYPEDL